MTLAVGLDAGPMGPSFGAPVIGAPTSPMTVATTTQYYYYCYYYYY